MMQKKIIIINKHNINKREINNKEKKKAKDD